MNIHMSYGYSAHKLKVRVRI